MSKKLFSIFPLLFLYYLILIFRSSFIFQGKQYFVLFDDMMISMRYAHNLSQGHGLTWNPGQQPVEGYSNFLWTLYMSLFHLLPIPLNLTSLFLQLTNAIFLTATVFLVYKSSRYLSKSSLVSIGAAVFTAFYFPLINWTVVLGTEVGILTLLTTLLVFLYLKNKKITLLSPLLLLLGILTRMDFATIAGAFLVFSFFANKESRKLTLFSTAFLGVCIGIGEYARFSYYHDLLPNTYYLKATGYPLIFRIARGAYVLKGLGTGILILGTLLGSLFLHRKNVFLLLLLVLVQILYSVFIGGDAWEFLGGANRYIAYVMPCFFILFFLVLSTLLQNFKKPLQENILFKIGVFLFLVFSFLSFNMGNDNTLFQLLLIKAPLNRQDSITNVQMAYDLTSHTKKTDTIAVSWAGIAPYFTDRTFVDLLGKNDRTIAHEKAHITGTGLRKVISFWPGHTKWDYKYSLEELKPDVVVTVYPVEDALPYLNRYYQQVKSGKSYFYVRKEENPNSLNLPETKKAFQ